MADKLEEKRKSIKNAENDIVEARVVANYDDPGLSELFHFDILSRYIIVCIESAYRVPTSDKWTEMFAVVARPESLWVSAPQGKSTSLTSQSRVDALGNTTIGVPGSFSTNGIPPINQPYQMGELIKFKKLPVSFNINTATAFFLSAFPDVGDSLVYSDNQTQGSTLPFFAGNNERISELKYKTLNQTNPDLPLKYNFRLYRRQYEAFFLNLVQSDSRMSQYCTSIFAGTLANSNAIFNANGGYLFANKQYIDIFSVAGVDMNLNGKARITVNDCLPLVVANPSSFPIPKTRTLSTINYSPSYSQITIDS